MTTFSAKQAQLQRVKNALEELRIANKRIDATVASDTCSHAVSTLFSTNNQNNQIYTGMIIECCPMTYSYTVLVNGLSMPIQCSALQVGGGSPLLLYDSSSYATGCSVLLTIDKKNYTGIILGIITFPQDAANKPLRLLLDNSSRPTADLTNKSVLLSGKTTETGILDYSMGHLIDNIDVGEFCKRATTGTQLFLDPFMTLMSVNDYTGLWVFENDSLTRLSGINLQMRTSGREDEYLNDEGEYIEYKGSVLYPYEQLGYVGTNPKNLIKLNNKEKWLKEGASDSFCDPATINAKPFHRLTKFGGWLGQGEQTQIILPPKDTEWVEFNKREQAPCASRVTQSVDGIVSIESAKGISITKRGMFPGAIRVDRPDEPKNKRGDNKEEYQNSSLILPKELSPKSENKGMERAVGIADQQGYTLNWKNVFPFAYHKQDYEIPEESNLPSKSIKVPDFSELKNKQYLSDEDAYKLDIDDRRKEQEYYPTEAGIVLLPEGGIVIYDGSGGEIRMVNGSITISAPGDISIKPGRSAHVWAGTDIIERAGKNIELSATKKSVRIKAEKHLELLGGNSGEGGVIIESKGAGNYDFNNVGDDIDSSGILLKANKGTISSVGDQLYFRSGYNEGGRGIFFDAERGKDSIYVFANDVTEYVDGAHSIHLGSVDSTIKKTTRFSEECSYLAGACSVEKEGYFGGTLMANGSFYINGVIGATKPVGDMFVAKIKDPETIEKPIKQYTTVITKVAPKLGKETYSKKIEPAIYENNKIGNEDILVGSGFSFRTTKQYDIPKSFVVYEDRWQNIAENSNAATSLWEETAVSATTEDTYPFPGKDYYTGDTGYVTQTTTIVDFANGYYKDRMDDKAPAEMYAEPKFGSQQEKSLQQYRII